MESIAAYADEGSNASLNEEGSSDVDEVNQGEETFPEKGDGIDAVDDNAEDGYREEKSSGGAQSDDDDGGDDASKDIDEEEESKDPPSPQVENPQESQEGEYSMSSDMVSKEPSQDVGRSDEDTGNAEMENQLDEETGNEDIQSDQNGLEEEEEEDDGEERVLPQQLTTPFSLASFLSSVAPHITDQDENEPSQSKDEPDLEFAYVAGTYARVAKNKVDINELDRRLDDLREQRREEIGLLKMYGLDDREDREGGGRDGGNDFRGGGRDKDQDDGGHRRSRSRSKDRDREKRRSKSKERRRSKSRERRPRSRDQIGRRERESPDRGSGRDDKDRYGRDREKSGRDREDKHKFGRDREDKGRDREDKGRDRERFGRDKDRLGRDRDREDRKDDREHGRSRSPRNDRRDNSRFSGRGEGSNQFRDVEKPRNDMQDKYGDKRGGDGPYSRKRDMGYPGGQEFYSSQQPPMPLPVPPPDAFPQNQFPGPQGFSQPPPPLDPFSTSIPPPQPWMGGPPGFQQPPPPQQGPPPPHHLGNYCQPPPPLPPPGNVNPMNNGDMNTLKQSLSILTGAASDPIGFGGQDTSQPPPSSWGVDTSYADSGPLDDDPMDLDMPSSSDDFQSRVVEEVKNAIRPFFNNREISKDYYKEILKKCVPKVTSSGEINAKKIANLVGAYVKKFKGRAK